MAEHHVARCDAPECTKEAPLVAMAITVTGGDPPIPGWSFSLPLGWRRIDSAVVCSWYCLARFAAHRADRAATGERP
jgi:hypothetical protein